MATHFAEILIKAPTEKVFDALTKPELIKRWQHDRILSTNWKTGSTIRFRTETEGKPLEQWGTVLEIRTNELIKYNLFTPRPDLEDRTENYCVTSYVLTHENGATKVELIQEDNRPSGFVGGTLMPILVGLKEIIEEK